MTPSSDKVATQPSPRLIAALCAVLLADVAASVGAYLRVGHWNPLTAIGRPTFIIILGLLAINQRGWVRWLLAAWLGFGTLVAFAQLAASVGLLVLQLVMLAYAGLNIWAILELAIDGLSGPPTKGV